MKSDGMSLPVPTSNEIAPQQEGLPRLMGQRSQSRQGLPRLMSHHQRRQSRQQELPRLMG